MPGLWLSVGPIAVFALVLLAWSSIRRQACVVNPFHHLKYFRAPGAIGAIGHPVRHHRCLDCGGPDGPFARRMTLHETAAFTGKCGYYKELVLRAGL